MSRVFSTSAIVVPHALGSNGVSSVRGRRSGPQSRLQVLARSFSDSHLRGRGPQSQLTTTIKDLSTKDSEDDSLRGPEDEEEAGVHADEPIRYASSFRQKHKSEYNLNTESMTSTYRPSAERLEQVKLFTKCMLAYAVASLASLSPLAQLFPSGQSQHMVATVAVYFNPARSIGGMFEANVYAIIAFVYALIVAVASMSTVLLFNSRHLILIGHILTLLLWVGGSMAVTAYVKDYKANATFSTACSLTTIIIFLVVVREGAVSLGIFDMERIIGVATVVICGCIISDLICFSLWPSRATVKAEDYMHKLRLSFAQSIRELPLNLSRSDILFDQALHVQSNRRSLILQNLHKSLQEVAWESRSSSLKLQVAFASLYRLQQYCSALRKISVQNQGLGASLAQTIQYPLKTLQDLCVIALEGGHPLTLELLSQISSAIKKLEDASRRGLDILESDCGPAGIPSSDLQDQIFPIIYFVFEYCEACEEVVTLMKSLHFFQPTAVDQAKQDRWVLNGALDKLLPPQVLTEEGPTNRSMSFRLWQIGTFLKTDRVKYAVKTGLGAALLAAPAFFGSTRAVFHDFRAEWSLVSYMIVSSPTSGTTSLLALQRIGGTALGALMAFLVWQCSGEAAWLVFAGCLVAAPCFWAMLFTSYSSGGRFALLAYNISALYTFNARERVHIGHICAARFLAVGAGVVWATIINNALWRRQSRKVLRNHITAYLLALGFFYRQLMHYSRNLARCHLSLPVEDVQEQTPLLAHASHSLNSSDVTVLKLQLFLAKMKAVLAEAKNEPRLKGAFSEEEYNSVLRRLQDITEHLILMRGAVRKSRKAKLASADTSPLVHLVMNLVWTLSAAFRSKIPLPPTITEAGVVHRDLLQSILGEIEGAPLSDLGTFAAISFLSQSQQIVDSLEEIEDMAVTLFGMYAESEEYLAGELLA